MPQFSKLQIRAKVMSVISEIKSLQYRNEKALRQFVQELDEIDDKEAVFDIFLKEYIKLEEEDYTFCACLIKQLVSVDYITEKSLEILKSNAYSDECKYKIVQLLRLAGGNYDYSQLPEYFENPRDVMDMETKRLLDSAVFNPESMLDFLDFVSAVSERDRLLLLKSLNIDYKGDVLANIVYPILYSNFDKNFTLEAIEILSDSKSSLAIAPFEYVIEVSDDEELVNACKIGLKKLKLAGASKEKADEYFKTIVRKSVPTKFYTTVPDGSGKQALLITRAHETGTFLLAAVVISDISGVVDCFGFYNISGEEVIKIIKKFYNSEGQYCVPAEYIRSRINFAEKINIKNKFSFPYEYICWNPIINDVEPMQKSYQEVVEEECKVRPLAMGDLAQLMTLPHTLRWFFTPSDNKIIKDITDKLYENPDMNIDEINQILRENTDNVFDDETLKIWEDRLYNLIYMLRCNEKITEADCFFSVLKDERLLKLFKQIIVQRSIFNYFVSVKENTKDSILTTNIFRKRNSNEQKIDVKRIDKILDTMKRNWIHE